MPLKFNPFTGTMDWVNAATAAGDDSKVKFNVDCDISAGVGSWVAYDVGTDNKVVVVTDNTDVSPVVGIIIAKPSTTTATVLFIGIAGGFTGMVRSKKVFLKADGNATQIAPVSGYRQTLGVATSATEIFVNPQLNRVLL